MLLQITSSHWKFGTLVVKCVYVPYLWWSQLTHIHRHNVIGIYMLIYTVTPTSRAILKAQNILWIVTSKKYRLKWIIVEK
jgi:hypothetical protein